MNVSVEEANRRIQSWKNRATQAEQHRDELWGALKRAHEQLGKHDYKGPKQIGRALATMEQALGIDHPDLEI